MIFRINQGNCWFISFIAKLLLAHSIIQKISGGSVPSHRSAAPGPRRGHVPLNRVCNGQRWRAKRTGGNFKFSGYGFDTDCNWLVQIGTGYYRLPIGTSWYRFVHLDTV